MRAGRASISGVYIGRLYTGSRRDKIWVLDEELAFLERAPKHLHLPLTLALWTGQRQGDQLKLTWSAYDGTHIRLKQSETVIVSLSRSEGHSRPRSTRRSSRAGSYCRARTISHGLRIGFAVRGKRLARKPTGVTFNDLRGTALTRLAIAGCTEAQIVSITGHTMRAVQSILDAHYLHRDPALAEEAIRKLEARTSQTSSQLGLRVLSRNRGKVQCDQLAGLPEYSSNRAVQ